MDREIKLSEPACRWVQAAMKWLMVAALLWICLPIGYVSGDVISKMGMSQMAQDKIGRNYVSPLLWGQSYYKYI